MKYPHATLRKRGRATRSRALSPRRLHNTYHKETHAPNPPVIIHPSSSHADAISERMQHSLSIFQAPSSVLYMVGFPYPTQQSPGVCGPSSYTNFFVSYKNLYPRYTTYIHFHARHLPLGISHSSQASVSIRSVIIQPVIPPTKIRVHPRIRAAHDPTFIAFTTIPHPTHPLYTQNEPQLESLHFRCPNSVALPPLLFFLRTHPSMQLSTRLTRMFFSSSFFKASTINIQSPDST